MVKRGECHLIHERPVSSLLFKPGTAPCSWAQEYNSDRQLSTRNIGNAASLAATAWRRPQRSNERKASPPHRSVAPQAGTGGFQFSVFTMLGKALAQPHRSLLSYFPVHALSQVSLSSVSPCTPPSSWRTVRPCRPGSQQQ